jgi:hypothetical protein
MTGVTRFGQLNDSYSYSKAEGLDPADKRAFDYLLVADAEPYLQMGTFELVEWVQGFLRLDYWGFKVVMKDSIGILRLVKSA